MNDHPPRFRLFRLTRPMHNGCTHAGEVWIGNRLWTITAKVVETPQGKQFHGEVEGPPEAIRRTTVPAQSPKGDLVSQAEGMPFDDTDKLKDTPF